MVVINQPSQQDEEQVYDVILVVEKTANLVPYLEEIKTNYLLPTLEFFNDGPPSAIDTGHDYNCTLYCLVTFSAGDAAPETVSDCTYPTTSTHELIQSFDNLQFLGGAGQSCSHVSEGLSTALQCLDEIKQLRYSGKQTERHCILICNSPPYHIVAEESQDYRGYNSEQLASMMGKRGVHLSIISPRKLPALQKLFNEACAGDNYHKSHPGYYATDPRHMVLLKGYQLQERSPTPTLEDDKKQLAAKGVANKGPSSQQQVPHTSQPVPPQQQADSLPGQANPSSMMGNLDPTMGQQSGSGPVGKQSFMGTIRSQGKVQAPPGMQSGQASMMQPRMRGQHPHPDASMMRGGPSQAMMNMQPGGGGVVMPGGPGGPMMNPAMAQQAAPSSQAGYPDQSGNPQMSAMGQGQLPQVPGPRDKRVVWSGTIEYQNRNLQTPGQPNSNFLLSCNVSVDVQDTDISTADWPQKLTIQLLQQGMLSGVQHLCKNARQVFFNFPTTNTNTDALKNFYMHMGKGFAGCVRFPQTCETKIILLMYSAKKKAFIGLIPHDQMGIMQGIKKVAQLYRTKAQGAAVAGMGPGGMPGAVTSQGPMMQMGLQQVSSAQGVGGQQQPQQAQAGQQPQQDQRRQASLQMMQSLQNDIQKQREMQQFQQQQGPGVDPNKAMMVQQQQQQSQQQVQQQQMMAHRAKMQQQHLQAQRLQMQQQQQQQQHQQQQVANPQLRHMLMNQQHQQQLRQQQLMMQQQQQQQMRGGAPQGQPMMGGAQQPMAQMAQQNFMDDFNLPEILGGQNLG